jgi:Transglutaminase-like superfamily/Coenzyme PQQ synthesis protein D (PqqD)
MSAPSPAIQNPPRPFTERARKHKDGSVLLSLNDDRICRLNGVGALTWMVFQEAENDLSLDEVVDRLRAQFAAINAEGELAYQVSRSQLRVDTASFLEKLVTLNLLQRVGKTSEKQLYRISEDVSGTTSPEATDVVSAEPEPEASLRTEEKVSKRETLTAFVGLLAFDFLLKFVGFRSLIERVERFPTAAPPSNDLATCRRVRAMVDRAQMYYPKKAMCLQHSAVVTCLLRRRGVPAQMVLAAHEFPVRVHAWSEVEGHVVNDHQTVKSRHREMRRV